MTLFDNAKDIVREIYRKEWEYISITEAFDALQDGDLRDKQEFSSLGINYNLTLVIL